MSDTVRIDPMRLVALLEATAAAHQLAPPVISGALYAADRDEAMRIVSGLAALLGEQTVETIQHDEWGCLSLPHISVLYPRRAA